MPKKYLLDTNIITYLQEQGSLFHRSVKSRLSGLHDDDQVYVSVFSFYEIEYGIAVSETEEMRKIFAAIKEAMRRSFSILPFTESGSEIFGMLKVGYMKFTTVHFL
jgi:predicted nucleic acid-binding protein